MGRLFPVHTKNGRAENSLPFYIVACFERYPWGQTHPGLIKVHSLKYLAQSRLGLIYLVEDDAALHLVFPKDSTFAFCLTIYMYLYIFAGLGVLPTFIFSYLNTSCELTFTFCLPHQDSAPTLHNQILCLDRKIKDLELLLHPPAATFSERLAHPVRRLVLQALEVEEQDLAALVPAPPALVCLAVPNHSNNNLDSGALAKQVLCLVELQAEELALGLPLALHLAQVVPL